MLNDKLKNYLHLHVIVFIWGYTAILGALISLEALPLVWYRMCIASAIVGVVLFFSKQKQKVPFKVKMRFVIAGCIIAVHWITFFLAIKVSNVSVTLACISTGAFFTAILEPIFYKRKIILYEILLGLVVIFGLYIIFEVETQYTLGILTALLSAFLSASFSIINGKLAKEYHATTISFYELLSGTVLITLFLLFQQKFNVAFFILSVSDWMYLFILASICTAYAFLNSVKVMRFLSPYTVMLTINLEPVYGILLAYFIFKEEEQMSSQFYVGGVIILATVVVNGILKNRRKRKSIA